jgi:dihydrofolate reductase
MRDLILTENITLDGVIDAAEGWFGPAGTDDVDESDQIAAVAGHMRAADAFLTGRVTFEQMRSYWPAQVGSDQTGVAEYLDRVRKYVVSRTIEDPAWEPTTVLRGPLTEEIERLKATPGGDIVVTGSMTLARALVAERLVDEYRLFVYPVVVGRGTRLFENATDVPRLELVESRRFRSGVVLLRYRAA